MSHSILIIEDQDADFEAVNRTLRRLGVENPVVRCTNMEDALDFLYGRGSHERDSLAQQPPGIIFLDLRLSGENGHELLARVKQDDYLKAIPVIVWSASTDPQDVEISYRLGANTFVRKAFDFAEINRTLEQLAHFWLETAVLPTK